MKLQRTSLVSLLKTMMIFRIIHRTNLMYVQHISFEKHEPQCDERVKDAKTLSSTLKRITIGMQTHGQYITLKWGEPPISIRLHLQACVGSTEAHKKRYPIPARARWFWRAAYPYQSESTRVCWRSSFKFSSSREKHIQNKWSPNLLWQGGGTTIYPVIWSLPLVKVKDKSQGIGFW